MTIELTTGKLRSKAWDLYDQANRLPIGELDEKRKLYREAAQCYRQAIAIYPPFPAGSHLQMDDLKGLDRSAKLCEVLSSDAEEA